MNNAKLIAKLRQQEIARKNANTGKSGKCRGAHEQLTDINRLIDCDHYKRKGMDLKISNKRDEIERLKREERYLRGYEYKHIKRDESGNAVEYMEKIKPREQATSYDETVLGVDLHLD